MSPLLDSLKAQHRRCGAGDEMCRHHCKRCDRMTGWRAAKAAAKQSGN